MEAWDAVEDGGDGAMGIQYVSSKAEPLTLLVRTHIFHVSLHVIPFFKAKFKSTHNSPS